MNCKFLVLCFIFVTWNVCSTKAEGLDLIPAVVAYQEEKTISFCSIVDGLGLEILEPILSKVGSLVGTILGTLSGATVSRTWLRAIPTQALRNFALSFYVGFITVVKLTLPLSVLLPFLSGVFVTVAFINGLLAGLVGFILGLLGDILTTLTGSGIRCAIKYGTYL